MENNNKVVEYLNKALKLELSAVNQFFLHSRILEDWGFKTLGKKMMKESIEEMHHADMIIKRILQIKGQPNLQDLANLKIGKTVKKIHEFDLMIEFEAKNIYIEAIMLCEKEKDYVTRELFVKILKDEEDHIDWLETRISLISQIGENNYLQSII